MACGSQTVKCLPTVLETWVRALGWEDPLEKEMETHSSTLAWKIPWTEEPGRLQSMGSQSRTRLSDFTSQWLRLHPPNAGDLDEGTRSHMPELKEFKCCN